MTAGLREAAQMAADVLLMHNSDPGYREDRIAAIAALRAALALPDQTKKRKPLSKKKLKRVIDDAWDDDLSDGGRTIGEICTQIVRAVEAAHNIKGAA